MTLSLPESLAFLRSHMVGAKTIEVDVFPDDDLPGFVFTIRPPGRSARYVSVITVNGFPVVSDLRPGCQTLTELSARKWAAESVRAS